MKCKKCGGTHIIKRFFVTELTFIDKRGEIDTKNTRIDNTSIKYMCTKCKNKSNKLEEVVNELC